jgi:hypothetical protein
MYGRFPHLSAFSRKFLEGCGAGLASAVIALLIGQTAKPAAPLSPIVYLSPADEQMIKVLHDDQTALLERLRNQPQVQTAPAVPAVGTPPVGTPAVTAPSKSVQAGSIRREPKPDRTVTTAKQRPDPRPVQSPIASKPPQVITVASHAVAAPPEPREPHNLPTPVTAAADADWLSTLKQIPAWFWPAGGGVWSEAPRPPLPVGNFLSRMM